MAEANTASRPASQRDLGGGCDKASGFKSCREPECATCYSARSRRSFFKVHILSGSYWNIFGVGTGLDTTASSVTIPFGRTNLLDSFQPLETMDGGDDQRENLGGVEEDRGQPRRRPVIRLSGAVASDAKSRSRARTLEPAPSKHPSFSADALKGATQATQSLLNAVDQASQLGDTEIDSGLTAADSQNRESASRWRAGNAPRRVTSALARLTTSLKKLDAGVVVYHFGRLNFLAGTDKGETSAA